MTVWPRDFGTVAAVREEDDGSFTLAAKSIINDLVPEVPGCVRGNVIISGFRLLPEQDGAHTRVVYLFQGKPH